MNMHGLSPNQPRFHQEPDIRDDIPAYIVTEKRGFFDDSDRLWDKGSKIYWEGEPNPGFEPLNQLGEDKLREYFTKLDQKAEEVSKLKGSGHASLVNAFESRRRLSELDRKSGISVDIDEEFPIMGAKRLGNKKAHAIGDTKGLTPLMGHQAKYQSKTARKDKEVA